MITSFINSHPQGSITSIAKDGTVQSSVVNVFESSDTEYSFMTKKDTRKYINIHNNPIISFLTYDPVSRTEVEIEGIGMLVTGIEEVDKIITKIRSDSKLGSFYTSPYVNESDDYALFTIYPRKMHMTTFWQRDTGTEVYHESIDFDTKMKT